MKLSIDETGAAASRSTHAVDIFAFVEAQEIPFSYFDTPYYLSPAPGGEKAYALLRETLDITKKIGIAHVVIQARRCLAALIPCGPVLILNTLRLTDRARVPAAERNGEQARVKLTEKELELAAALVESMTQKCDLDDYGEAFREDVAMPERPAGKMPKHAKAGFSAFSERLGAGRSFAELAERLPQDGAAGGRGDGYQAQRNSRPRPRLRRILH